MKILFYGTKNYDEEFFEKLLPSYPGITIKFTEANIHEETASLAKGYEAICAFVNADLSTHALYKCPAISGVFHQKKGHPILPDFVLTDQKQ